MCADFDRDETQPLDGHSTRREQVRDVPDRIGRYRVEGLLGRGGFGEVYLGQDDQLERPVAIKVARGDVVQDSEDGESALNEARVLAQLDHPHIVPVHDVGSTSAFPVFIVSKFVPGEDLGERIRRKRLPCSASVEIVISIAEALHYAHRQGLVHRDVKPANILLDEEGRAYLSDFGLALHADRLGQGPELAGTPAYMSPEQARGEGHRVDGRSDVFSLGVVLYQLLSGRLPFQGKGPRQTLDSVIHQEPRPLRQWEDGISRELERICLRAMSKRATDRYSTALDFAEELRLVLQEEQLSAASGGWSRGPHSSSRPTARTAAGGSTAKTSGAGADTQRKEGVDSSHDSSLLNLGSVGPPRIVPKGLRAFDSRDADFFLELVPGPRDRFGLPAQIRFWKGRLEQEDANETFPVGVLYGPSGCGKSSLVRAGLAPRLAPGVQVVYVEATATDTERRLSRGIQHLGVPTQPSLSATVASLRRRSAHPEGCHKVVLVLDQFEQWLHARNQQSVHEESELFRTLRQCDGGCVQALLLVRDDFWLSLSRLMQDLEIPLREGHNSALVDLFDEEHACRVLAAFGLAYGRLSDPPDREQQQFLRQAVEELAQDGKVVCVRLALLAEMMKGRPWTTATLRQLGGAAGVGERFLDEMFTSSTAPPTHRLHQRAARRVLQALLPPGDASLKGYMQPIGELLRQSGYQQQPQQFQQLLDILDPQLRLITPTDPRGEVLEEEETASADSPMEPPQTDDPQTDDPQTDDPQTDDPQTDDPQTDDPQTDDPQTDDPVGDSETRYYQLSHDFLVPSLRLWLRRKQQETRRGRAELQLSELASWWESSPDRRRLPDLGQYLRICLWTRRSQWREGQRRMMRAATRRHGVRVGAALGVTAAVLMVVAGIYARSARQHRQQLAHNLVQRLQTSELETLPEALRDVRRQRQLVTPYLTQAYRQSDAGSRERLRLSVALLEHLPQRAEQESSYLLAQLDQLTAAELKLLRPLVAARASLFQEPLWTLATEPGAGSGVRQRAAAWLASLDADDPRWEQVAPRLARSLVSSSPLSLPVWIDLFEPLSQVLLPELRRLAIEPTLGASEQRVAIETAARYASDQPELLAEMLLEAPSAIHFLAVYPALATHRQQVIPRLEAELDRQLEPQWNDPPTDTAGTTVPATVEGRLAAAEGMLHEHFAFCQTLPLTALDSLDAQLVPAGYRLTRLRPWSDEDQTRVAAIWRRDGRETRHAIAMAEDIRQRDAELATEDFQPADVAAFLTPENEERYAAVWVRKKDDEPTTHMYVGLRREEYRQTVRQWSSQGWERFTYSSVQPPSGKHYAGVWAETPFYTKSRIIAGTELLQEVQPGCRLVDASIEVAPPADWRATLERDLRRNLAQLDEDSDDLKAHWNSAVCRLYLRKLSEALENARKLEEHDYPNCHGLAAIIHAELQDIESANEALEKQRAKSPQTSSTVYFESLVGILAGDSEASLTRLEELLDANKADPSYLWMMSRVYATAAGESNDPEAQRVFVDRALELIHQAAQLDPDLIGGIAAEPRFESLRGNSGYRQLLSSLQTDRRWTGVWWSDGRFATIALQNLTPEEHQRQARSQTDDGKRPSVISVRELPSGDVTCVSIWEEPLLAVENLAELNKRKANATVALVKLRGVGPEILAMFSHSSDPTGRSYIIHLLKSCEVPVAILLDEFNLASDLSVRRAILLALGEYDRDSFSSSNYERARKLLRDALRNPDAGTHAAAEWTLRQWGESPSAELSEQANSESVDREWRLAPEGITMVRIDGPAEFLSGSPASEPGRRGNEWQIRRQIPQAFAISSHEITVDQFQRFLLETGFRSDYNRVFSPYRDSPQTYVSWFLAATYCNWLSQKAGLPSREWCYLPNSDGKFGYPGMRLAPNYRERSGFRLPSAAEWEYAARAGAKTRFYFGSAEELSHHYARSHDNSDEHAWPVGQLKPNEFGLFDMLGNVQEWCSDGPNTSPGPIDTLDTEPVTMSTSRQVRGGSYRFHLPSCGGRSDSRPGFRDLGRGFRVARYMD